ncbi:MAG: hypothetical protein K5873_04950 [Treponema sp.]|nr:hypothetical protein [Treponema sp.]
MKKFNSQFLASSLLTAILLLLSLAMILPLSCRLTEEGIEIIPADLTAPSVEEFSVTGEKSISITCSEKIVLDEIAVVEVGEDEDLDQLLLNLKGEGDERVFALANAVTYSEDRKSAEIELSRATDVGKGYVFCGKVFDITGNSLEFAQKFSGHNENPARLMFNEVRTSYNKSKMAGEYIEFYVLKGGNTYGLEFLSAANGENGKYTFPAMEVEGGEYITLHGRIFDEEADKAISEYGKDLTLSKACESCDSARDLWKEGNKKIASNNDVLLLRDWSSSAIKDALLLSSAGKSEWSKKTMEQYAKEVNELGIWPDGADPLSAVSTEGMSTSILRSISRQNTAALIRKYGDASTLPDFIAGHSGDWLVTDKLTVDRLVISGASPGFENSSNPYSPAN